jgi:uncharacterized membrane protein
MTLTPLLESPFIIQLHFLSALPALVVGPFAIWGRTSRKTHKRLGYTWVTAMAVLAISGLFIPSHDLAMVWHFGPIHLFSVFALWGISRGVWLARAGRIAEHQIAMRSTWFGAMGLAGLFNFLPGRTVNQMVFGGPSDAGWIIIALGVIGLLYVRRTTARPFVRTVS